MPKATSAGHSPEEQEAENPLLTLSLISRVALRIILFLLDKTDGVKLQDFPILLKTLVVIFLFLLQIKPRGGKR